MFSESESRKEASTARDKVKRPLRERGAVL